MAIASGKLSYISRLMCVLLIMRMSGRKQMSLRGCAEGGEDLDHPGDRSRYLVAIDIDGVVADLTSAFAEYVNAQIGTSFTVDMAVEGSFLWFPGLSEHVARSLYDEFTRGGHMRAVQPYPDAAAFLSMMSKGCWRGRVVLLTSRPDAAKLDTLWWLQELGFGDIPVIFANDKNAIIEKQGIKMVLEDNRVVLASIDAIPARHKLLISRPWNRGSEASAASINDMGFVRLSSLVNAVIVLDGLRDCIDG
jgi:hypothetical protein